MNIRNIMINAWLRVIVYALMASLIVVNAIGFQIHHNNDYTLIKLILIPAFFAIVCVIIKISVVRIVTGLSKLRACLLSLFMIAATASVIAVMIILTVLFDPVISVFYIPILIVILGIAYRLKASPNPFDGLYIIISILVAMPILGNLFSGNQVYLYSLINIIPFVLLAPLVEVWPARVFLPKAKAEKAVILSILATTAFISVTYLFIWLALKNL